MMRSFAQCAVEHVPREQNKQADRLATKAVEGHANASHTTVEGKRVEA